MAETKDRILSMSLVAIVVIIIAVATPGCLMGGDDGDSAKSADGHGVDLGQSSGPNNPPVVTETEKAKRTSVPVKHLTEKEFQRLGESTTKEGVLYLYKFKDDEDSTYGMPVGFIVLDKNKLSGLEFSFEETHFSNFNTKVGEYGVTITADVEASKSDILWGFGLLSSSKKESVGSGGGAECYGESDGKINIGFTHDEWEKGRFISISLRNPC